MKTTLKLELPHLQGFAFGAAATNACHTLSPKVTRLFVDNNKSVIRWFNERRQASRLLELMGIDVALGTWPTPTFANDTEVVGLQAADLLTYFATKQMHEPRFRPGFSLMLPKSTFLGHSFAPQVFSPYAAPDGVSVGPLLRPRK